MWCATGFNSGPLLFTLYINDICNISDFVDFILFADDTTIISAHRDMGVLYRHVNIELKKIMQVVLFE